MKNAYVTTPHGVTFIDPDGDIVEVCRRPVDHKGDCAISPQPGDLTLREATAWLVGTFQEPTTDLHRVAAFAQDMLRMLDGLEAVSFPVPNGVRITLDPEDDSAIYLTEETARRIHAALEKALEAR